VNAWKVILATIVIFGAGVVTGALVVRHSTQAPAAVRPHGMGAPRLEFLRRAERELNLKPDQRERIDRILKASQERTRKLMEPVAPELRAELEQTKNEFLAVLTPEQRTRFEVLIKKQHQRPREPRHSPATRGTSAPPASLQQ
jgi:Spy/CpxP family protein refolding chaperone